jgi:formylglycine-generating enzyme required for sulfatase activity
MPIDADVGDCGPILPGMVCIPGGTFLMGATYVMGETEEGNPSNNPPHTVNVRSFQMDVTEVTVAAYRKCIDADVCHVDVPDGMDPLDCELATPGRDDYPINCVNVTNAVLYCLWAGKRLPREEEWEYAAQRPDQRIYPWGNSAPGAARLNVCAQECDSTSFPWNDSYPSLAPVGSFPEGQSFDGLLDMAGNVWEWTQSPWCAYPEGGSCDACKVDTEGCVNPCSVCDNPAFIARGGGFADTEDKNFRVYLRGTFDKTKGSGGIGFRCAR